MLSNEIGIYSSLKYKHLLNERQAGKSKGKHILNCVLSILNIPHFENKPLLFFDDT